MNWIQDAVSEFGRQVGISSLDLGPQESIQLTFASGTVLAVEPVNRPEEEEVLVSLGRPAGHQVAPLLRTAFVKAHMANGGAMPVQIVTRGSGPQTLLVAVVRLQRRAFTPQALSQAVEFLGRWLDDAEAGRNR